jgi:hypothetical protein
MTTTQVAYETTLRGGPDGDSGERLAVSGVAPVLDSKWHNEDELMVLVQVDPASLPREYQHRAYHVWCLPGEWTA